MNVSILIRTIIGLSFFQGVYSYAGFPSFHIRVLIDLLILILFCVFINFIILRKDKSFRSPGLIWIFVFTVVVFASALMNNSKAYSSINMYSRLLLPYLFFLSILNINLSSNSIQKINKFIVIIVLLQIPAALYKYAIYGVIEGGIIGTFSTQAGALSTLLPLFIISYLIAFYYCYKKNPIYLLLILGFIFFAWGGGKRAFFIFLPVLIFIAYVIYNTSLKGYKINGLRVVLSFLIVLTVIGFTIYLGGRLNPVFNPEKERWGSFDLSYMVTQAINTQTQSRIPQSGETMGRISSFNAAADHIIFNGDLQRKLFGDGPDKLDKSDDQRGSYGIRYGISGATFNLISTGLLGALSFFFLFFTFGIKTYRYVVSLKDPFYLAIAFGTTLAIIVFSFDYLFYSVAFFSSYIPSLLFFYMVAILFKQYSREDKFFE